MLDGKAIEQSAHTPNLRGQEELDPGLSRYVEVADLPWKPTQSPGIEMKILLQDKSTGLMTALFRWQPGARLAMHEHVEIEQSFVLSGSIVDDEGEATEGKLRVASQGASPLRGFAPWRRYPDDVLASEHLPGGVRRPVSGIDRRARSAEIT